MIAIEMSKEQRSLLTMPSISWLTIATNVLALTGFALLGIAAGLHLVHPVLAMIVLSWLAFVTFTPMHDASHRSVARNRVVNEIVGWLSGVALMAPFSAFRFVHLEHHRYTNDPVRDPDQWSGTGPRWTQPLRWVTQDIYYYVWYAKRASQRPKSEVLYTILGAVAFLSLAAFFVVKGYWAEVILFWLIPARLGIGLLAFAFDWLPHHPHNVLASEQPLQATSIIEHRGLTPVLLSQNYHLIHHLYPGVPFYRYGRVWWTLRDQFVDRGAKVISFGGVGKQPLPHESVERVHSLEVVKIHTESHDTRSIEVKVPPHLLSWYRYQPGQFVTLELPTNEGVVRRSYSLSRATLEQDRLRITVKLVNQGVGSSFLHNRVYIGDRLRVSLPQGRFTLRNSEDRAPLAFLAAGSGITPIRAMVEQALTQTQRKIVLFYASRDAMSVVFRSELNEMLEQFPSRLTVIYHVDNEGGVPTAEQIARVLSEIPDANVYSCGPEAFMTIATQAMDGMQIPKARRFSERFTPVAQTNNLPTVASEGTMEVRLDGTRRKLKVLAGETLLKAASRQGVTMPSSCEEGYCGTCAAKLVSGEVSMPKLGALRDDEIANGIILPCQAKPASSELIVLEW